MNKVVSVGHINIKLFPGLFFALIFLLQYKLWFMQGGIISSWRLNSAIHTKEENNQRLLMRNNQLAAEIRAWKTGSTMIEAHARYELGMIKEGEVFYHIVK